jgi:NADH-ubiquinone oxidoreductase chain 6
LIYEGLTYIGFSYLIVYIGAVSILFLFILMLINIRTSELQSNNSNSIPLGLFIIVLLEYILSQISPYSIVTTNNEDKSSNLQLIPYTDTNNIFTYIIEIFMNEKSIPNIMYAASNC